MNENHNADTMKRLKSLAAVIAVFILVSCQDNRFAATRGTGVTVGVAVSGVRDVATKSGQLPERSIGSMVVEGFDGGDLIVEVFESDYTDLPFEAGETKGSVVDNTSINAEGSSFVVNAWLGSTNRYDGGDTNGRVYEAADATDYHFIKSGAAVKGTSGWALTDSGGNDYIWRNAVPTTFWSHYPASMPDDVTRSITFPGTTATDAEQKELSFTYSIGSGTDATELKDLLFAYNLGKVEYEDANNADHGKLLSGSESIDVHFYHALPAIRFDVSGLVRKGKVIKAITLEGIASSGSCEVVAVDGAIGINSFNWTLGSGKVTVRQEFTASDFTEQSVDNNPATGSKDANTLQAFSNGKIFFPLPQPVKNKGIKVTIEYSHTGDDITLTKSFVLDHDEAWQAGKYYTYRLSVTGVDLHVDDKVTDNVKSDLVIKNVGAERAYIRAMIAGNWVNKDGDILLEWDPEDNATGTIVWGSGNAAWTLGSDGFYYHQAAVAPGAEASQLFESYTVTNRPSILEDSDYLEFIITAQSVLADTGKASAIAAWGSTAAGYLND